MNNPTIYTNMMVFEYFKMQKTNFQTPTWMVPTTAPQPSAKPSLPPPQSKKLKPLTVSFKLSLFQMHSHLLLLLLLLQLSHPTQLPIHKSQIDFLRGFVRFFVWLKTPDSSPISSFINLGFAVAAMPSEGLNL